MQQTAEADLSVTNVVHTTTAKIKPRRFAALMIWKLPRQLLSDSQSLALQNNLQKISCEGIIQ